MVELVASGTTVSVAVQTYATGCATADQTYTSEPHTDTVTVGRVVDLNRGVTQKVSWLILQDR